ncbi:hypothetical protein PVAP13_1NG120319 [Panicum virgatum]|uniref:DUF4220 domain-containing protein n=1 Tax=Panicum virgatum TaxID=38727 RepID=A0A8T0WTF1_PANVG|nr:hypothetical protein PVAP13_1NG120319 [Panicum virgatum]
MAAVDPVRLLRNEWALHVLVLLSFTLQVMLLITAEFRRRLDSGVLRVFIWSAYMLADSVAIYTIGPLAATSKSGEHSLMALLCLRHLQTFAVHVAGAAYVLYVSLVANSGYDLQRAAILLVVGAVKYGERVMALIHADSGLSTKKGLLQIAHHTLDIAKDLMKGRLRYIFESFPGNWKMSVEVSYKVAEMQLSLMHDVLYGKAEVIHTWYDLCARAFSLAATAIAALLFHLHLARVRNYPYHYTKKDVVVTYALLAGAVILESVSGLRSMFSIWTWAFLRNSTLCNFCPRDDVPSVGCTCPRRSTLRNSWGRAVLERWGSRYPGPSSSSLPVPTKEHRVVLESFDLELEEAILVWHIATGIYLHRYRRQKRMDGGGAWQEGDDDDLVEAVEALSNYMLFLLAVRPYMLPPLPSRWYYAMVCSSLIRIQWRSYRRHRHLSSIEDLFDRNGQILSSSGTYLQGAAGDAPGMKVLELIAQVWVEMLCYVGVRCSAHSHAVQLSNGGELITLAALLVRYYETGQLQSSGRSASSSV